MKIDQLDNSPKVAATDARVRNAVPSGKDAQMPSMGRPAACGAGGALDRPAHAAGIKA